LNWITPDTGSLEVHPYTSLLGATFLDDDEKNTKVQRPVRKQRPREKINKTEDAKK
jgi:hypothetical protein